MKDTERVLLVDCLIPRYTCWKKVATVHICFQRQVLHSIMHINTNVTRVKRILKPFQNSSAKSNYFLLCSNNK